MKYEIDGVVYKLSSPSHRSEVGGRTRSPRWCIAHKFTADFATTEILKIAPQVGRTGAITPVARLTPVNVGGVTVSKASLHNYYLARRMLKGVKEGARVKVERAGDVIPKVVGLVSSGDGTEIVSGVEPPSSCPSCGSSVSFEWEKGESGEGQVLRCGGGRFVCDAQVRGAVSYAVARGRLDVRGMSEARVGQVRGRRAGDDGTHVLRTDANARLFSLSRRGGAASGPRNADVWWRRGALRTVRRPRTERGGGRPQRLG